MDIFSYESARRIGDQNVLRKVDALLDWSFGFAASEKRFEPISFGAPELR